MMMPLFVQRGYNLHCSAKNEAKLNHWVMDAEKGFLLEPMRAGICLTTGAELNDLNSPPHYKQLAAEKVALKRLTLGKRRPSKGNRPCLPDMKPVIGPAASELLAQIMDGEEPAVNMAPFRVDRF